MTEESASVSSPCFSAGILPVGLSSRQPGGGSNGNTVSTRCSSRFSSAATITLRTWMDSGTP